MGRFYGMGQAIGLLGQQLMQQSAAEEARKDKEAMLEETLQQRRDAAELNAQTQMFAAKQNADAKRIQETTARMDTPYGLMDDANVQQASATIAGMGGFDPETTFNAMQHLRRQPVAPDKLAAAQALAATDAFKHFYTTVSQGKNYKAFEEGENQRLANTGTETLIKKGAGVNAIAAFNGAVKGSPQYNSDSNLYTGELSAAGKANNNARIAAARAGGAQQDLLTKYAMQAALLDIKNTAKSAQDITKGIDTVATKFATVGGVFSKDRFFEMRDELTRMMQDGGSGAPAGYSGQGLLNMGVGQAPAGGSVFGK